MEAHPRNHFFLLSKKRKRIQIKCKRKLAKMEPRGRNDQRVSNVRVHEDGTLDGPNNRGVCAGYEA